jgi:hypothetical protein
VGQPGQGGRLIDKTPDQESRTVSTGSSREGVSRSPYNSGARERSGHRTQESRVDVLGHRPDALGDVIGRHGLSFEQSQEQGSTGSADVDVSMFFEKCMSLILATLSFLSARVAVAVRGAHDRPPFDVALGGLHPPAMKASISAISQRREAPSLKPAGIFPASASR